MNKGEYRLSINRAFEDVIKQCGKLREEEEGAWLGPEMTRAYTELKNQRLRCQRRGVG